jgi:hypothetical protein
MIYIDNHRKIIHSVVVSNWKQRFMFVVIGNGIPSSLWVMSPFFINQCRSLLTFTLRLKNEYRFSHYLMSNSQPSQVAIAPLQFFLVHSSTTTSQFVKIKIGKRTGHLPSKCLPLASIPLANCRYSIKRPPLMYFWIFAIIRTCSMLSKYPFKSASTTWVYHLLGTRSLPVMCLCSLFQVVIQSSSV